MGYYAKKHMMQQVLDQMKEEYLIYAPKKMPGEGTFTDTCVVRYQQIDSADEIEWKQKSNYSFKEVLLPITQTLFYFTEDEVKEAAIERKKGAVIFLRSCDLHAVRRLDEIYLKNGFEDAYYKRLRGNVKFILIGCSASYENCFCVSMGTNQAENYDAAVNIRENGFEIDSKWEQLTAWLQAADTKAAKVSPDYISENEIQVTIPENLSLKVMESKMWDEYDLRCINCGRCNFVCPTCTCFSMQDIFYTDNKKVGERRRVHASCMVDGYTDVAGGGCYRQKNGQRMRFKVLHKIYDYKKKFGYHMCTGCGRCDDVCPEYISYSHIINKLEKGMQEVTDHEK